MQKTAELSNFSFAHEIAYQLKVSDAMTTNVITLSPQDTIRNARNILKEKRISGLPVVKDKKLVGIISVEDIIRALDENDIDSQVEKRMSKDVKTLDPNLTLIKALNILDKYPYGRFPIVDNQGNLLGIMTPSDIIRRLLIELNSMADAIAIRESSRMSQGDSLILQHKQIIVEGKLRAGDYENIGILSNALKKKLQQLGVKPEIVRRSAIATYEAETNIIIHSIGGSLKVWIEKGKITIEANDEGPGISDIDLALQPGYSTASSQIRALGFGAGMGLPNIKQCSDTFYIDSHPGKGTLLIAEVLLSPSESEIKTGENHGANII